MGVGWLILTAVLMYFFRCATPVTIADFMEVKIYDKIYLLSKGNASQPDAKEHCSSISADFALFDTNQEYCNVTSQLHYFFSEKNITVLGIWVDLQVIKNNSKTNVSWRNEDFDPGVWYYTDPDGSCKDASKEPCCARIEWENVPGKVNPINKCPQKVDVSAEMHKYRSSAVNRLNANISEKPLQVNTEEENEAEEEENEAEEEEWHNFIYQSLKDSKCTSNSYNYLCIPRNECSNTTHNNCSQICLEKNDGYLCACKDGYRLESDGRTCRDINECVEGAKPCNQTCTNTNGSYSCSCLPGYELMADGWSCNDTNECLANTSGCQQECSNTLGSYHCYCHAGYNLSSVDRKSCIDVNECNSSDCQQNCTNTDGSYTCHCFQGYALAGDLKLCYDIDECKNTGHRCSQVCNNTPGGYECSCHLGYVLNTGNTSCSDKDECQGPHFCQQLCNNTDGSYQCSCTNGYELSQDNKTCEDIDECEFGNNSCDHICNNTNGSYSCSCNASYFLGADQMTCIRLRDCNNNNRSLCGCQVGFRVHSDGITCEDIDECQESSKCAQICTNTEGSFVCGCRPGYRLLADNATCISVNESLLCMHSCVDTGGSLNCTCYEGYTLHSDMRSCVDVNECAASPCQHMCTNTEGSYECACQQGYTPTANGSLCIVEDEITTYICSGVCQSTEGSYQSGECLPGYKENHGACQDIDECANNNTNNCSQLCRNATGTYKCSDVDAESPTCINTNGSYHCACPAGFYPTPDNSSLCHDLSTCQATLPMCGRHCDNTSWASFCNCHKGFKLQRNSSSCNTLHPSLMCPCTCTAGKRFPSNANFSAVIKEMTLNRKKTFSYRRKKISIPDHRPSSQTIGYSGLIIMCLLFGCIVSLDILPLALSLVGRRKRTSKIGTSRSMR